MNNPANWSPEVFAYLMSIKTTLDSLVYFFWTYNAIASLYVYFASLFISDRMRSNLRIAYLARATSTFGVLVLCSGALVMTVAFGNHIALWGNFIALAAQPMFAVGVTLRLFDRGDIALSANQWVGRSWCAGALLSGVAVAWYM